VQTAATSFHSCAETLRREMLYLRLTQSLGSPRARARYHPPSSSAVTAVLRVRGCTGARVAAVLAREKGDRPTKIPHSRCVVHTWHVTLRKKVTSGKEGREKERESRRKCSPHSLSLFPFASIFRTDPSQPSGITKKFAMFWMHPVCHNRQTGMKNYRALAYNYCW